MRSIGLTFTFLILSLSWVSGSASDPLDASRALGEQMLFKCLATEEQLECLVAAGFSCTSVGKPAWNSYSCNVSLDSGCYRARFQLTANGWSSNDKWLPAECEDSHEPVLQPGVRMMFDNTNAPDGVRLEQLLSSVFRESVHSKDDRALRRYIAPGANAKTGYEEVAQYFVSTYWSIENEIHDERISILCEDELPRFKDARLRETFDSFDDLRLAVYEEHLPGVRKRFDGDDTFDFDAALYGFPAAFSVHILETRGPIDALYDSAERICTAPFTMNFTTVGDVE